MGMVKSCRDRILNSPSLAKLMYFVLRGRLRAPGRKRNGGPSSAARILIVRIDEIGDTILTTPCLRELRKSYPNSFITLIVNPVVFNLVERCPYVDEILVFDFPQNSNRIARLWHVIKFARRNFTRMDFDLAILPRWDFDIRHGAFLVYCSGARVRLGYSEKVNATKGSMNKGFDRFFTSVLVDQDPRHELEYDLEIIRHLGVKVSSSEMELWIGNEDRELAQSHLQRLGVHDDEMLIACCPGAGKNTKMWPVDNYVKVCAEISRNYGIKFLIFGGPDEKALGLRFEEPGGENFINLVGKFTLRQTIAFLGRCRMYIGNDTGTMHMAAALKLTVVEICCHPLNGPALHLHSPIRFGPWNTDHSILRPAEAIAPCRLFCSSTQAHCITRVEVEQVQTAAESYLSRWHPKSHKTNVAKSRL